MRIVSLEQDNTTVTIGWDEAGSEIFHYLWLRDNALSVENMDPTTGERMANYHDLPANPRPVRAEIDNGDLLLVWEGNVGACRYPAAWLHANAYSDAARTRRAAVIPAACRWDFNDWNEGPAFDFRAIERDANVELAFLLSFRRYGVAYLKNTPAEAGIARSLCERLGYLRDTAFGPVREVRSDPDSYANVAGSSLEVNPHMDAVNYREPYEVQFLHCIANAAQGGNSRIVDALQLGQRLRVDQPAHFDTLGRVPVSYRIGSGAHDVRAEAPVFELDRAGELRFVRFSNQQRRTLSVPHDDVEKFYIAYHAFSAMVNDPANQFHFRFHPGDALMFNNHRILHGRSSFDPATGLRHLQLATTDLDMVDSRIRLLVKQLAEPADSLRQLPDEVAGMALANAR